MKTLILLLSLTLSLSTFAEQIKEFKHKAYCAENPQGRESKISQITKISENDQEVIFSMVLSHGLCDSIDMVEAPIKFQKRMIQVTDYGFSYPFKKVTAKVLDFKALTESEVETEIAIQKSALAGRDSRRFILDFWASDWIGYPWVMNVQSNAGEIEVTFEGFERL